MTIINIESLPRRWVKQFKLGRFHNAVDFVEKKGVKPTDFMKVGTTCLVFNYDQTRVIKLCTKDISGLVAFNQSPQSFRTIVNEKFNKYFLPINEVLYEDADAFIYTQDKVRILDLLEIDRCIYSKILDVIKKMYKDKIITHDIISSNFGFTDSGEFLMLDSHDLDTLDSYSAQSRYYKVAFCLIVFSSYLLYHKNFDMQFGEQLDLWKQPSYVASRNYAEGFFPPQIVEVIKAVTKDQHSDIEKSINECQQWLQHSTLYFSPNMQDNSPTVSAAPPARVMQPKRAAPPAPVLSNVSVTSPISNLPNAKTVPTVKVAADAKTVPTAKVASDAKTMPSVKTASDAKTVPSVKTASDVKTVSSVKATPDAKTVPSVKAAPDAKIVPSIKAVPDAKPVSSVKAVPDAKTVSSVKTAPDVKTVSSIKATPDAKAVSSVKTAPDVKTVSSIKAAPDAKTVLSVNVAPDVKPASDIKIVTTVKAVNEEKTAPIAKTVSTTKTVPVLKDASVVPSKSAVHVAKIVQDTDPSVAKIVSSKSDLKVSVVPATMMVKDDKAKKLKEIDPANDKKKLKDVTIAKGEKDVERNKDDKDYKKSRDTFITKDDKIKHITLGRDDKKVRDVVVAKDEKKKYKDDKHKQKSR